MPKSVHASPFRLEVAKPYTRLGASPPYRLLDCLPFLSAFCLNKKNQQNKITYVVRKIISMDADVFSWGWGKDGQLGHGDRRSEKRPTNLEFLKGHDIVQVACGGWHSASLTVNGDVFTWGSGRCGQLGQGDWASHRLPCVVAALQGKEIVQACDFSSSKS